MASLPSARLFPLMGLVRGVVLVIITKPPTEDPGMLSLPGNPRHWPQDPRRCPVGGLCSKGITTVIGLILREH